MPERTIRLLHRIAVDWSADTFGLRGRPAGRERNEAAAARAAARHARAQARGQAAARALPAPLHSRREPRVLRGWQDWIGWRGRASGGRA
ncbi:MAG TPA: hypothetical protein VFV41_14795 [Streptosporangiaceae bacterium]|nr:hypothetical protein [Streptosporangiaceae bacterium]